MEGGDLLRIYIIDGQSYTIVGRIIGGDKDEKIFLADEYFCLQLVMFNSIKK